MSDLNGSQGSGPNGPQEHIPAEQISAVDALLRGEEPKPAEKPGAKPEPVKDAAPEAKNESEAETPPATPEPGREAEKGDKQSEKAEGEGEQPDPEAEKFYAQEVKLSNGQTMTVGELKDMAQEFDSRTLSLIERETAVVKQYHELQEMAGYLNLPEGVKEAIAQQQAAYLSGQHDLMLKAIPEWTDRAAFEKGRAAIHELGQEYGVDLSRVTDHKVVKMLHDYARLKAAVKQARENVKPIRTPEPKGKPAVRTSATQTAIDRAKQTGSEADKTRAVEALLRG